MSAMMKPKAATRYCHYCGANSGAADFCGVCFPLLAGDVKQRMQAARKWSNPQRARLIGREALDALKAAGVKVPERRKDHES